MQCFIQQINEYSECSIRPSNDAMPVFVKYKCIIMIITSEQFGTCVGGQSQYSKCGKSTEVSNFNIIILQNTFPESSAINMSGPNSLEC